MSTYKFKTRVIYKLSIILTILFLVTLSFFYQFIPQAYCVALGLFRSHLSDEQMTSNLIKNKQDFDLLIEMIKADSEVIRVDNTWSDLSNISSDKLYEYRKMFVKLGIPRGFYASRDRSGFRFISSSQGMVTHGSSKSYVYSDEPIENLVESLDEMSQKERPFGEGCKKIEEYWYICFEGD